MNIHCSACGQPLVAGARHCSACGLSLTAIAMPTPGRWYRRHPVLLVLVLLLAAVFWAASDTPNTSMPTQSAVSAPKALTPPNLGAPAPLNAYTNAQLKVIGALYSGKMNGPRLFQQHCGKADASYVRSGGDWAGATTLMYSSGQNRTIRDDVSVLIARRDNLPQWVGDMYAQGKEDSRYAIQVYLATSGIDKVALDPARAVILLGCHE